MKIKITQLEEIIGYKIKKNYKCIGLDTAKRTGLAFINTTDQYANIDFMFLEFKDAGNTKDIYRTMVKTFEQVIIDQNFATIEQVFVGFNRAGSVELSRYGSFAIAECIKKNIDYELISAQSCRCKFGIKTTKKAGYGKGKSKLAVADWLRDKLGLNIEDEDISDAILLALLGIMKGVNFQGKGK